MVVAEGVNNREPNPAFAALLQERAQELYTRLEGQDARSHPHAAVWRDAFEVVYATGSQIRTRKWVWRQGELAKVAPATSRIFVPIDAFYGVTDKPAREAQAELAALVEHHFGVTARTFWVDRETPSVAIG